MNRRVWLAWGVVAAALLCSGAVRAQTSGGVVYRCPGKPPLYTDALSPKEAQSQGCTVLDGVPITVVPAFKPRANGTAASGSANARVDPADQKARDSDARRILEAEVKREEERLAALKDEYKNGEPERRGDEKNYQKYAERVADLKAAIARKESDLIAIRRELSKLGP